MFDILLAHEHSTGLMFLLGLVVVMALTPMAVVLFRDGNSSIESNSDSGMSTGKSDKIITE